MAESTATAQERDWTADLRRERLETLRRGRLTPSSEFSDMRQSIPGMNGTRGSGLERQSRLGAVRQGRQAARDPEAARQALPGPIRRFVPASVANVAADEVEKNILRLQRAGWQRAHEVVEGLAFAFFWLAALVMGPIALALYGIRFFVGNVFKGGFSIQIQGVSVRAVPSMEIVELVYRTARVLFITILSAVLWALLILIIYFITHPLEAVGTAFQSLVEAFTASLNTTP